jgi:hypothetical protein
VGAQESAEAVVPRVNEPGNTPEGLTTREGLNLIGRSDPGWTGAGVEAERPSRSRVNGAETEYGDVLRDDQEPPDADPHVRWCGSRGEQSPPATRFLPSYP